MEILHLSAHHEYVETVASWIWNEWKETSELTMEQVREQLADRPTRPPALIAVDGTRVLGVLGFRRVKYRGRDPHLLFINSLFVTASDRGRGVGSALVAAAINHVSSEDAALYVYTDIQAWYENRGFTLVERDTENGNAVLRRIVSP